MKRLPVIILLLSTTLISCKREATPASTEAEAMDYVRIVAIAASNVYTERSQSIPSTPCTDPVFNMRKTSKFLTIDRCTVRFDSDHSYTVAAVFNKDIAILSDPQGTRRVQVSELPEVK